MPKTKTLKEESPAHRGRPREFDREQALLQALDVFWQRGYEPASVAQLCTAMGIKPPSLYAAFGNKAELFLEAAEYYEKTFWSEAKRAIEAEEDVRVAITNFFLAAAAILTSTSAPCGCLVVLAAVNVSVESQPVMDTLWQLRQNSRETFTRRLARAKHERQLAADADVPALAATLYALIEGMSLQARDGATQAELEKIARTAGVFLPA